MLLDASRSHATGILVEFCAKGHNGLHRFESGTAARDAVKREAQSPASGNIGEFHDWLVTLSEGPYCSHDCSVGFVESSPSAKCNLIITRAHSGVKHMARSMEIGGKFPRYAFACSSCLTIMILQEA